MRVVLVWPYYGEPKNDYVPLSLAFLKANVSAEKHEIIILDTVLKKLPPDSREFIDDIKRLKPDLVGFSITSNKFANAVLYARQIKADMPHVRTMVGGIHVTSYKEETMSFDCFDYGFIGEADLVFEHCLDTLEQGVRFEDAPGLCYRKTDGAVQFNDNPAPNDLNLIQRPNYRDIDLFSYYKAGYRYLHGAYGHAPIWISRGCPYTCKYCAVPDLNGRNMRYHDEAYVEAWIRDLHDNFGVRHVNIIDDNFTFEMPTAKSMLRMLIRLQNEYKNLSYAFPNGIRMQRVDDEMLDLFKAANFSYLTYAPESGSDTMLRLMSKGLRAALIEPAIRKVKEKGIRILTFWIVGYPGETPETMEETRQMIRKCDPDLISLHMFQALPGTPIFEKLVSEGKIHRSYLPQSFHHRSQDDYVTEALTNKQILRWIQRLCIEHFLFRPWNLLFYLRTMGFRLFCYNVTRIVLQMLRYDRVHTVRRMFWKSTPSRSEGAATR